MNPHTPSIILQECVTKEHRRIFRETIDTFHSYVKYKDTPTRRIYWLVFETSSGNQIGAIGIASAVLAASSRDHFIGWSSEARKRNLRHLANNSRFCLVQSRVTLPNAASMTLKSLRLTGANRWREKYGDDLLLLETFVLAPREESFFGHMTRSGACYRADNWIFVGETQGSHICKSPLRLWARGGNDERSRLARENPKECLRKYSAYLGEGNITGFRVTEVPPKMMFVRPLVRDWKERLCLVGLP